MAKKKELPEAQLGALVRGIAGGFKAIKNTKSIKTGLSAAKKGFSRGIEADKKAAALKKSEKAASTTTTSNTTTPKPKEKTTIKDKAKNIKTKVTNLTPKQKLAIGVGTGAAVGGYKYATRKRRTLND